MNATRVGLRSGGVCGMALLLAVLAWGKTYTMQAAALEPGAVAKLDVKAEANNTQLAMKVEHLAKPTLLSRPASNYVVWVLQAGQAPANVGVLHIDDNLKGEARATTTATRFTVLVTAENDTKVQTPSDRVVLRADVQE